MENNIKFRNHISVVFENIIRSLGVILFIFIGNFLTSEGDADLLEGALYIGLFVGGVMILLLIWQLIVWAKTYIIIQENTLIIERNTLNKKRNTIGLKNVSNVNLEQNLMEMLLGTCKVKLDTNTLTTAEQTDVSIVLKKKDAEKFRQMILGKVETEQTGTGEAKGEQRQIVAGMDEIIVHGIFSINFFSVLMLVGVIGGAVAMISEFSVEDLQGDLMEVLFSVLVIVWVIGGIIWNIVKGFIKYIDFKIERKKDKILINYGLLKKVAYSIPVDKINAVRLGQTPLARLGKRYTAEIINVGIDDDENEEQCFLLPYAKKDKIIAQLHMLLPEFDGCIDIQEEKQPKCIWMIWLPMLLLYFVIAGIVYGTVMEFVPELKVPALVVMGIIIALLVISKIASYLTVGCAVDSHFLKVVEGSFGRRILFVKYDKIQYITAKQNVIAKNFKVQKGMIHLLASIKNQIQEMPYMNEEKMEVLKLHLLK